MKKLLMRLYVGFSATVSICLPIHFIVAQLAGSCVTPVLAARFAGPDAAAIVQLALVGVIGMAFAGAALIFEMEKWSYLQQGIVHFLVTAAVWLPIVIYCGWTPATMPGVVCTVGGWALTYAVNWTVQYFIYRRRVTDLNRKIRDFRRGEN